jgi:hypothetical protein
MMHTRDLVPHTKPCMNVAKDSVLTIAVWFLQLVDGANLAWEPEGDERCRLEVVGGDVGHSTVLFYRDDGSDGVDMVLPPDDDAGGAVKIHGPEGTYRVRVEDVGGNLAPSNEIELTLNPGPPVALSMADSFKEVRFGELTGGCQLKLQDRGGNDVPDLGGAHSTVRLRAKGGLAISVMRGGAKATLKMPIFFVKRLRDELEEAARMSPASNTGDPGDDDNTDSEDDDRVREPEDDEDEDDGGEGPRLVVTLRHAPASKQKKVARRADSPVFHLVIPADELRVEEDSRLEAIAQAFVDEPAHPLVSGTPLTFQTRITLHGHHERDFGAAGDARFKVTHALTRPAPGGGGETVQLEMDEGGLVSILGEDTMTAGEYTVKSEVFYKEAANSVDHGTRERLCRTSHTFSVEPGDLSQIVFAQAPQAPIRVDNVRSRAILDRVVIRFEDQAGNEVIPPHPTVLRFAVLPEGGGAPLQEPRLEGNGALPVPQGRKQVTVSVAVAPQAEGNNGRYRLVIVAHGPEGIPPLEVPFAYRHARREGEEGRLRDDVAKCIDGARRADLKLRTLQKDKAVGDALLKDKRHLLATKIREWESIFGREAMEHVLGLLGSSRWDDATQAVEAAKGRIGDERSVARSGLDQATRARVELLTGGRGANHFLGTLAELACMADDEEAKAVALACTDELKMLVPRTAEQQQALEDDPQIADAFRILALAMANPRKQESKKLPHEYGRNGRGGATDQALRTQFGNPRYVMDRLITVGIDEPVARKVRDVLYAAFQDTLICDTKAQAIAYRQHVIAAQAMCPKIITLDGSILIGSGMHIPRARKSFEMGTPWEAVPAYFAGQPVTESEAWRQLEAYQQEIEAAEGAEQSAAGMERAVVQAREDVREARERLDAALVGLKTLFPAHYGACTADGVMRDGLPRAAEAARGEPSASQAPGGKKRPREPDGVGNKRKSR